jgi:DNA-binding transcriptional ArsR family regulator
MTGRGPRPQAEVGMARESFAPELLELIAGRFRLLAEPVRLRLLNALRSGERTVSELVAETGAGQANVSRHLALLHRQRVVSRRKDGLRVYYRIEDRAVFDLCELVCGSLEEDLRRRQRDLAS